MPSSETRTSPFPACQRPMLHKAKSPTLVERDIGRVCQRGPPGVRVADVSPPSDARQPETMILDAEAAAIVGRGLVKNAQARVHALTDGHVDVEAFIRRGPVVDILVDLARDVRRSSCSTGGSHGFDGCSRAPSPQASPGAAPFRWYPSRSTGPHGHRTSRT
jgi:hypothetical protein